MLKVLMTIGGVLAAGPAWAGCYHYSGDGAFEPTETPPRAEICFQGRCETTALQFTCGNASGASAGFENGWQISRFRNDGADPEDPMTGAEEEVVVTRNGEEVVDLRTLECRPIDEGGCEGTGF